MQRDRTYLQRDLRRTAARTGQLLNVADLARGADVAPNTARSSLSILEASGSSPCCRRGTATSASTYSRSPSFIS